MSASRFNWKLFFSRLYDRSIDADIFGRSAQVAFYFSFALFPLLYFLVSVFGILLTSSDELRKELFSYLHQIMPFSVFSLVRKTIDEIAVSSTGSKALIGLAIALWSTSAGVDALRTSLNSIYEIKETRNFVWTKFQSLIFTFIVAIITVAMLAVVFYGWQLFGILLDKLGFEITSPFVLIGIQWVSILLLMLFACEIIFNLLPNFEKGHKWIWITYGSIVAIVLWLVLTTGFRIYLGYFDTYDKTYGSLGAVIILMLWLYLTAMALMGGGAINAILLDMRDAPEDLLEEIRLKADGK
jgi:membrane protein